MGARHSRYSYCPLLTAEQTKGLYYPHYYLRKRCGPGFLLGIKSDVFLKNTPEFMSKFQNHRRQRSSIRETERRKDAQDNALYQTVLVEPTF